MSSCLVEFIGFQCSQSAGSLKNYGLPLSLYHQVYNLAFDLWVLSPSPSASIQQSRPLMLLYLHHPPRSYCADLVFERKYLRIL